AKYNGQGEFQQAMNIYSPAKATMSHLNATTDSEENLYLAFDFRENVSLQDTILSAPSETNAILLAKFSSTFEMQWFKFINTSANDNARGLKCTIDNYIYLLTEHNIYSSNDDAAKNPGGDSSERITALSTISKVNPDGSYLWQYDIQNVDSHRSFALQDASDNLTIAGNTKKDLVYRHDTIFHPNPDNTRPFILEIDSTGTLRSGTILDWHISLTDGVHDAFGNFFFTGFLWESIVFGGDTINPAVPDAKIIAKLDDNYDPSWATSAECTSGHGTPKFYLDTYQDTLFFAAEGRGILTVFDTTFDVGAYYDVLAGQITPEGQLNGYTVSNTTRGFRTLDFQLDNCHNFLVSGWLKGKLFMEQDTIQNYSLAFEDGALAGISRHRPEQNPLGADTLVCDSVILEAPPGYTYYYWNDSICSDNSIKIEESGIYTLEYANEDGCWRRDTIYVDVQPGFEVNLGKDTTLAPQDTLVLSVSDTLESYLWSDGSPGDSLVIPGDIVGTDGIDVWVQATKGVCTSTDTLHIESSASIPELTEIGVTLHPNPVKDKLYIKTGKQIEKIELLNSQGRQLRKISYPNQINNPVILDMSPYNKGIYFINVKLEKEIGVGKVIKL
ncbi:MAG: T9SS type A sorting domain-containing protein, partial [Bacteroidales bacterium]|nr:T9SS type A sorting domain-containing protein [Bacteroidales bacterium]